MSPRPLRLGISSCPNDTFAFHALLSDRVPTAPEIQFEIGDVQELNERMFRGELDVAKVSFFAALRLADEIWVLPSGSALGYGVGPVLLAAPGVAASAAERESLRGRVLCPGEWTTAHLLYRLFRAGQGEVSQRVFSDIMPALRRREAEYGVCIHEGRFTYASHGLRRVEDLGRTWEERTQAPLPLGGLVGRRELGTRVLGEFQNALRRSLEFGLAHRAETLPTMRRHAQEFDDDVIFSHVDLYVNEHTLDLGSEGRGALATLDELARAAGLLPANAAPLEVLEVP